MVGASNQHSHFERMVAYDLHTVVSNLNQLSNDADGDLTGRIVAEFQSNGALELTRKFFGQAFGLQVSSQHTRLLPTTNNTYERRFSASQDFG